MHWAGPEWAGPCSRPYADGLRLLPSRLPEGAFQVAVPVLSLGWYIKILEALRSMTCSYFCRNKHRQFIILQLWRPEVRHVELPSSTMCLWRRQSVLCAASVPLLWLSLVGMSLPCPLLCWCFELFSVTTAECAERSFSQTKQGAKNERPKSIFSQES